MKLAIMQPYIFPYLGYFQLIQAVDKFVVYDDVAFIKQGWINRNQILLNGEKHFFNVPVNNISSFKEIKETCISDKPINWERKLLRTFVQAYKKAPFFNEVFPLIEEVISNRSKQEISILALNSIKAVLQYLAIEKTIIDSSSIYNNKELKGEKRVIDICKQEKSETYLNPIGGLELYDKSSFAKAQINLFFLKPQLEPYSQHNKTFIAGLSIIDVLMFCPKHDVYKMLNKYILI